MPSAEPATRTTAPPLSTTLVNLCQGGIYDHVGGGFARYAIDDRWLVPHFEKMLYDNGLLLWVLSFAQQETPQPLFRMRIDETVGWLAREMQLPAGGFAASLDADTDHEEGLTYTWSFDELQEILGDDLASFAAIYDASPAGNWEGKIILNRLLPAARDWLGDAREEELAALRAKLLGRRSHRPQPPRDDKVLADWNGLAIAGLAAAARVNVSAAARNAALAAFRFVAESMSDGRPPGAFGARRRSRLSRRRDRLRQHDPCRAGALRVRRRFDVHRPRRDMVRSRSAASLRRNRVCLQPRRR